MLDKTERLELRLSLSGAIEAEQAEEAISIASELFEAGTTADITFCNSALKKITSQMLSQSLCRKLTTYIVRSVTVEPILPSLSVAAMIGGYVLDIVVGGYGSYMDEMLSPDSSLSKVHPDLVLVLLDLEEISGRLPELCTAGKASEIEEELEESVTRVAQMLRSYRARGAGRLVLQGCVLPSATSFGDVAEANIKFSLANTVRKLNERLLDLCQTISDCIFFDLDQAAARYGRNQWTDQRLFLSSRLPVATNAFQAYSHDLVRTFSVLFRAPRKVLCTDLDDTLWGGILGEDGVSGIVTGSAFPGNCYLEYQRYLKGLAARGILLAIVSKNNESDVMEAFKVRAADLAVAPSDFVAIKTGWNDKSEALKILAVELSLGLDSFVFVDDNPVECEAIKQQLPLVAVVNAPVQSPWNLVPLLSKESYFDVATVTSDDVNRVTEYKAQAEREALDKSIPSRGEFLQSLGIVCSFVSATEAPLARSAQLLAKTNQFNLTTRRHSASDVERFASTPSGQAIAVRVRDRFGDSGVAGLALCLTKSDACVIDSFLLSCRVIGRGVETALLSEIAARAVRAGSKWLIGEYIPSSKNTPSLDFYSKHGFTEETIRAPDDVIRYRLDLSGKIPETPPWIEVEGETRYEFRETAGIAS